MNLLAPYAKSLRYLSFLLMLVLSSPQAWAQSLRIGTITNAPVNEIRVYQHLADYLQQQLADQGVQSVEVKMAANIEQMVGLLKRQEIDLYIDSAMTVQIVNQQAGSKYLLRRWKKGRPAYRSVIAVRADSAINHLDDLKNQTIAFEEPFSTSGFILPSLSLIQQGVKLTDNTHAVEGQLRFRFGYDSETQITWLERGKVQAAAMSEKDFNDLSANALTPLRVLLTTPEVPYHLIANRSGLDQSLVSQIKSVLLAADQTEAGRQMLQQFERTSRFDETPQHLLDNMHQLAPHLQLLPIVQE